MNTEYVLQVYMLGAGWLDFEVYYDKAAAEKDAAVRGSKGDQVRVINGDEEDSAAFNASLEIV